MIIKKIWAANIRNIKERVELSPAPSGLTLLHAPNEFGKSTLADSIRILMTYSHTSMKQELALMMRPDSQTGPTLGLEFELAGATYRLEKTWLQGKRCTLERIAPDHLIYPQNAESENALEQLLAENFDPTLWNILQIQQGRAVSLPALQESTQSESLARAFDLAASSATSQVASSIWELLGEEYKRWFTPNGGEAKSKGTDGLRLKELRQNAHQLQETIEKYEKRLDELSTIEVSGTGATTDAARLQELAKTQRLIAERKRISDYLNQITAIEKEALALVNENPQLAHWSIDKFSELRKTYGAHRAYLALPKVVISALQATTISEAGQQSDLAPGDSREIPVINNNSVRIADVVDLTFVSADNDVDTAAGSQRFLQLLVELQVPDYETAEQINAIFQNWTRLNGQVNQAHASPAFAESQQRFALLEEARTSNLALWTDAENHDAITEEMLVATGKEEATFEARADAVRADAVLDGLDRAQTELRTVQTLIHDMQLERGATKLLHETIMRQKENQSARYSKIFQDAFNEVARNVFGENVTFAVDGDFNILTRNHDGISLDIKQLSVGATEQISIIARTALAQIASTVGPVPLILDDDLTHTDLGRLRAIGAVFQSLPGLQILIFTCHPDWFRELDISKEVELGA